eukprot:7389295-Prymnesium_polylepis.1
MFAHWLGARSPTTNPPNFCHQAESSATFRMVARSRGGSLRELCPTVCTESPHTVRACGCGSVLAVRPSQGFCGTQSPSSRSNRATSSPPRHGSGTSRRRTTSPPATSAHCTGRSR